MWCAVRRLLSPDGDVNYAACRAIQRRPAVPGTRSHRAGCWPGKSGPCGKPKSIGGTPETLALRRSPGFPAELSRRHPFLIQRVQADQQQALGFLRRGKLLQPGRESRAAR